MCICEKATLRKKTAKEQSANWLELKFHRKMMWTLILSQQLKASLSYIMNLCLKNMEEYLD